MAAVPSGENQTARYLPVAAVTIDPGPTVAGRKYQVDDDCGLSGADVDAELLQKTEPLARQYRFT
jgi:hypothetical protein